MDTFLIFVGNNVATMSIGDDSNKEDSVNNHRMHTENTLRAALNVSNNSPIDHSVGYGTEQQPKMDVDVEMKSLSNTPTKSTTDKMLALTNLIRRDGERVLKDDHSVNTSMSASVSGLNNLKKRNQDDQDGDERMEVSEHTSPVSGQIMMISTEKQLEQTTNYLSSTSLSRDEHLEQIISKILDATWNEYCTGAMICPQMASFLEQYPQKRFDFMNIVPDVLIECVLRIYNDEQNLSSRNELNEDNKPGSSSTAQINGKRDVESMVTDEDQQQTSLNKKENENQMETIETSTSNAENTNGTAITSLSIASTPTYATPKKIKSNDSEVQEIMANANRTDQPSTSRNLPGIGDTMVSGKSSTNMYTFGSTNKRNVVLYLIKCHGNYIKFKEHFNMKTNGTTTPTSATNETIVYNMIGEQIMRTTILVLTDRIYENMNLAADQSVILDLYHLERLPEVFLNDLIEFSYEQPKDFEQIFNQLLRSLFLGMQRTIFTLTMVTHQIELLTKLVSYKLKAMRPFCDLVAQQQNFLPPLCTQIQGREIVKCSFLGPFLSVSFFSEENLHFTEANLKFDSLNNRSEKFRWVSENIYQQII